MTKKYSSLYLLCLGLIGVFTSCNPRVSNVMIKTYPSLSPETTVKVFEKQELVPANAESLGIISVGDAGMTVNCDSLSMINLLKNKAKTFGANAVLITKHTKPSFWGSSCHQFTATVLRIKDISEIQDSSNTDDTAQKNSPTYVSNSTNDIIYRNRKLPRWELGVDAGYSIRTASIAADLNAEQRSVAQDLSSGFGWDVYADYYFTDWYGIRLVYTQYNASSDRTAIDAYGITTSMTKDIILFIGPAFMCRLATNNAKLIFQTGVGLGYTGYKSTCIMENIYKPSLYGGTIGAYFVLGLEYKFLENLGIAANFSGTTGALSGMTLEMNGSTQEIHFPDTYKEGLGLLNFQLGLRFHIQ